MREINFVLQMSVTCLLINQFYGIWYFFSYVILTVIIKFATPKIICLLTKRRQFTRFCELTSFRVGNNWTRAVQLLPMLTYTLKDVNSQNLVKLLRIFE